MDRTVTFHTSDATPRCDRTHGATVMRSAANMVVGNSHTPEKMSDDDVVFVEKCGIQAVNVHPIVLFSILEHHLRRDEEDNRVIGKGGGWRVAQGRSQVAHPCGDTVTRRLLPPARALRGARAPSL